MKPRSIFCLKRERQREIYNEATLQKVRQLTDNDGAVYSTETILKRPEWFKDVEIIFSGWGCPRMDAELLGALPNLKAIFYGAGSVKGFVTDGFWDRDILLTSAYPANAVPVAEYTVASVVFALKKAWVFNRKLRQGEDGRKTVTVPGVYHGSTVGIISLGAIGRLVCEKLAGMDLDVVAYDPFAPDSVFQQLGVRCAASLESLFAECSVVSLHAPKLPETEHMITGKLLRSMGAGATFINTSRGRIVAEAEMIAVLTEREDLFAVIDVIVDETDYSASPLADLPNVFLTSHIAGSKGLECHRMGAMAVEECRRYLNSQPPLAPVTRETAKQMA